MTSYLKENDITVQDGNDVNFIKRDMMSIILEGALDQEMEEEPGYSKYDYRNKETDNSRNGHSQKTLHTSYGDMQIDIPRDRQGEFEPKIIKKYQNTVTQDMEEKIISMYAKGMAEPASRRSLCGCIYGCHTLQRETGGADQKESCLYCPWHRYEWS